MRKTHLCKINRRAKTSTSLTSPSKPRKKICKNCLPSVARFAPSTCSPTRSRGCPGDVPLSAWQRSPRQRMQSSRWTAPGCSTAASASLRRERKNLRHRPCRLLRQSLCGGPVHADNANRRSRSNQKPAQFSPTGAVPGNRRRMTYQPSMITAISGSAGIKNPVNCASTMATMSAATEIGR